jgi:hypothetical protein
MDETFLKPIKPGTVLRAFGKTDEEEDTFLKPIRPGITLGVPEGLPKVERVVNFVGPDKEWGDYGFSGFGGPSAAEQKSKPFGLQALEFGLSLLEPLLFVGDVAKAAVYGAATGGTKEALRLATEQAKQVLAYAPLGAKPKTLVTGDDLSRVFIEGYDQMPAWKRMGTSFLMEVVTDPLSLFGVVGAAAKGGAITTKAVGFAGAARGLEKVTRAAATADRLANAAFNPFAQAVGAARAIGRVSLNDEGRRVADLAGDVMSGILGFKIFGQRIRVPDAGEADAPIRLVDFFDAFGTPNERKEFWNKLQRLTGGPEYGGTAIARARDEALGLQRLTMAYIEELQGIIHDGLGTERNFFNLFKRKVIAPEAMPVYNVIKEQTQRIIDQFGVLDSAPEAEKSAAIVKQVAKGTGVSEAAAEATFRRYLQTSQAMFADLTYRFSGVDLYKKFFFEEAERVGVNAEEAWKRHMALKSGGIAAEPTGTGLKVEQVKLGVTPGPMRILDDTIKHTRTALEQAIKQGKDPSYQLRLFLALPATDQLAYLEKYSDLAKVYEQYAKVVKDFTTYVKKVRVPKPDELKRYADNFLVGGERGTIDEEVIDSMISSIKGATGPDMSMMWTAVERLADSISPDGVMQLLATQSKGKKGRWEKLLGFMTLGRAAEKQGDYQTGLAFYSMAASLGLRYANDLTDPMAAVTRHLHANGAIIDPKRAVVLENLGKFVQKRIDQIVQADELTKDTIQSLTKAIDFLPAGIRSDAVKYFADLDTPVAKLAKSVVTKNGEEIRAILTDALTGKIKADKGGVQALVDLARRVLGEEGLYKTLKELGLAPDNIEQWRVQFPEMLDQISNAALKRWWIERPHWAGIADESSLFGRVGEKGWEGAPQSPLQYFENLRRGYARRVYFGKVNPEAASAAMIKGRMQLIPEIKEDQLEAARKVLIAAGKPQDVVDKALGAFAKYINDTGGQTAYSIEPILAIFKANGLDLDQRAFNEFIATAMGFDKKAAAVRIAIKESQSGVARGSTSLLAERAETFQKRVEGADILLRAMDPEASAAEFSRFASRSVFGSVMRNEVYKALKEAGLILDKPPDVSVLHKWRKVGDKSATINVEPIGPTLPYGPLQGKWIPEPVFNWLVRSLSIQPMSEGALAAFLSFWRKALLNNPRTAIVNGIGNYFLMWANMGEEFAVEAVAQTPRAMRLLNQYYNKGELPKEIEGAVHFLHEVNLNTEMRMATDRAIRSLLKENPDIYTKGAVERAIQWVDRYANHYGEEIAKALGKEKNPYIKMTSFIELFAYMENVSRLSAYLAARQLGADVPKALWTSANAIFDYSQVPYALNIVRNSGIVPFPAFMYFTAKGAIKWATQRPAAFIIPQDLSEASFYAGTDNPEDHARIYTYMPDWLKSSMPMVVPIRHKDGSYVVIPLINIFPIRPFDAGIISDVLGFGAYGPLIDAASGIVNYFEDPVREGRPQLGQRFGERLYPAGSTFTEAVRGSLDYAARQYLPTWATRFFPVMDAHEIVALTLGGQKSNGELLLGVRSLLGKTIVQYTNPILVSYFERQEQKALGFSLPETATGFIATPRVISPHPLGITSGSTVRGLLREKEQIERAIKDAAERGRDTKDLTARLQRLLRELGAEMQPLLKLNEMFGPPPKLPPVQNPFEGR